MPPTLTSLQVVFHPSEYRRPLDAALHFVGSYTDRDVIIAAVDEAWTIESIRDELAELDPERAGLLITLAAANLPAANDALDNAMQPQLSGAGRRLRQLDRTLHRRLGTQYRITAYFPPYVLAGEPTIQNLNPGAIPEPAATDSARQPAVMLVMMLPMPAAGQPPI